MLIRDRQHWSRAVGNLAKRTKTAIYVILRPIYQQISHLECVRRSQQTGEMSILKLSKLKAYTQIKLVLKTCHVFNKFTKQVSHKFTKRTHHKQFTKRTYHVVSMQFAYSLPCHVELVIRLQGSQYRFFQNSIKPILLLGVYTYTILIMMFI